MSITRAQVSGLSALATWLNENATAFFSSVGTDGTNVWSAWDNDGNKVLNFATSWIKAFRADNSAEVQTGNRISNIGSNGIDIIACDNGIIIDTVGYNSDGAGQTVRVGILITKTNNDKVAIIFSCGEGDMRSTNYLYLKLRHAAIGDSTTMSTTTTFTPESGNQTVITPFVTNADVGGKSYTPSAGYMPAHSNYGSGLNKFLLGADMYITNGYWCIKDGGAA